MITPAEKEVILAKDLAYALHLPDAPPDAVKTFVKALLSDDIATLQMLTRTKISIVKNSTVEDIKSTCDTACFIAGTLVETAKGLIPIEQIGFGDLIWSREEFGEDYAYKPVVTTKATDNQQLVEIIAENPQGQQEVYKTTLEHPFYVENIGWLKASLLSPEMRLLDRDGMASLRVVSQQVLDNYATVYNIMVDDHHTYHIGEFGIWVHNAKCCDLNTNVADIRSSVTNNGRIHMNGNYLQQKVNSIGYNKDELLEVKTILENSIKVRKLEKNKFRGGLDSGHKERIRIEQDALDKVNRMLKELK